MILSLFVGFFRSVLPQFCVSGQNETFEKSFCVFGYVPRKRYVGKSTAPGKAGTKKHLEWYRTDSRVDSRELRFRITKTFSPIVSCHLPFYQPCCAIRASFWISEMGRREFCAYTSIHILVMFMIFVTLRYIYRTAQI